MKNEQKKLKDLTHNEMWKLWLTEGGKGLERVAPVTIKALHGISTGALRRIPSEPRCISCEAPFMGIGAPFMRAIGRDRSRYNPSLCTSCEEQALKFGARAEVPLTMLFADIRGSTTLAEQMSPEEFSNLVSRFYGLASTILTEERAFIDKLIGDEASAFFVPGLAGDDHASPALKAAKEILRRTGHGDEAGPWVPVGIGIHSGKGVVGAVGDAVELRDITALGDVPNTAARLASQAKSGEIVLSNASAVLGGIETQGMRQKTFTLKGKSEAVDGWIVNFKRDGESD